MKICNLDAGIGGNRRKWNGVKVTAVEINPDIAAVYADLFPGDTVIVGDSLDFLLKHYKEYDFIWISRPCQSHSRIRQFVGVNAKGYGAIYPDMSLYQVIIFLQHNAKCSWVVENVNPYYEPLIKPTAQIGRHLFWSNFDIPYLDVKAQNLRTRNAIADVESLHDLDLSKYKIADKRQIYALWLLNRHFLTTRSLRLKRIVFVNQANFYDAKNDRQRISHRDADTAGFARTEAPCFAFQQRHCLRDGD